MMNSFIASFFFLEDDHNKNLVAQVQGKSLGFSYFRCELYFYAQLSFFENIYCFVAFLSLSSMMLQGFTQVLILCATETQEKSDLIYNLWCTSCSSFRQ